MNNTSKMTALLSELRRQMNGAVVESMEQRGISYEASLGVSLLTIKNLALAYVPDDDFARFLLRQPYRELQLAAFFIANPSTCTEADLDMWSRGVNNIELAENFSLFLSRTSVAESYVVSQIATTIESLDATRAENPDTCSPANPDTEKSEPVDHATYITYASLLVLSRLAARFSADYVAAVAEHFAHSPQPLLRRAAENLVV